MSRYNDAARSSNPEPEVDTGRCFATGCPLPGAISESTKGGGPWFCRFHFGAQPERWPSIAEGLRDGSIRIEANETSAVRAMREVVAKVSEQRARARISEPA